MTTTTIWVARLAWLAVAVFGGSAVDGAVAGRSDAVRWVAGIGCWTVWAVVVLALAVPAVRSLTIARIGVPLGVVVGLASAIAGATAGDAALLVVPAIIAVVAVLAPEFGRAFVQSSAYGDEERFLLRAPVAAGAAAVAAWVVWAPTVVAGPLLLATRSWVAGAIVTAIAVVGTALLFPGWHRLSRRWLVLVPAGLVVHDPVVLADTLMLRTREVAGLGLARVDTEAADLTGPASGHAIEVRATGTVTTVFASTPAEPNGRAIHMTGFLVSPTRPGAALHAAAARGLRVS